MKDMSKMRAINATILNESKARYDNFKAWLKWNHPGTDWDRNNTLDEIILHTEVWQDYLKQERKR